MGNRCFIASLLVAVLLSAGGGIALGAEGLTILSGGAAKSALIDAIAAYEKAADHKVAADFAPMGALTKKIEAGARADVLVLSAEVMTKRRRRVGSHPIQSSRSAGSASAWLCMKMRLLPTSRRRKPSRQHCWRPSRS